MVTLCIGHKVLLPASLQVPFGWLADLQLPVSQGNLSRYLSVRYSVNLYSYHCC